MRADLRAKRPLLYQEVVNALYQIIDTSNLKPGDQMPAERELMEQLGVSRNVLREAFHILEQRGIITSQQGKGRFLREIPISQLGEDKQEEMSKNLERYSLYEAYEVRQVLETKAMDLIVRNATDADLDEIEAALDDNNVDRYAKYLHKLTKYTQFIVITHRRGTMAAADRLYGITMQEKGVSTLVSVDLLEDDLDK